MYDYASDLFMENQRLRGMLRRCMELAEYHKKTSESLTKKLNQADSDYGLIRSENRRLATENAVLKNAEACSRLKGWSLKRARKS